MIKDGTYAAWFKTPLGEGSGITMSQTGKSGVVKHYDLQRLFRNQRRSVHRHRIDQKAQSSVPIILPFGLRECAPAR
jgi:hypothetical protein